MSYPTQGAAKAKATELLKARTELEIIVELEEPINPRILSMSKKGSLLYCMMKNEMSQRSLLTESGGSVLKILSFANDYTLEASQVISLMRTILPVKKQNPSPTPL
jgi:hypothetical protein